MPHKLDMKNKILTIVIFIVSFLICAPLAFFVAIVLAGPLAGLFPLWIEGIIRAFSWVIAIFVPMFLAIKFYHKNNDVSKI